MSREKVPNKNSVCVGIISGAHGVKGDLLLKSFTQDPEAIFNYQPLLDFTGERSFNFQRKSQTAKGFVVALAGIADRAQAQALRQIKLYCPKDRLIAEDEDAFLYADLEGLEVQDDTGQIVGKVTSVQDYGAGVYLEGQTMADKLFTLPFTKEAVLDVCLKQGYLVAQTHFILTT